MTKLYIAFLALLMLSFEFHACDNGYKHMESTVSESPNALRYFKVVLNNYYLLSSPKNKESIISKIYENDFLQYRFEYSIALDTLCLKKDTLIKPYFKVYSPQLNKEGLVSGVSLIEIDSSVFKAMSYTFEQSSEACICATMIYTKFKQYYDAGEYEKAKEAVSPLNEEGHKCMEDLYIKYGRDDSKKNVDLFKSYMKNYCPAHDEITDYLKKIKAPSTLSQESDDCSNEYDLLMYEQGNKFAIILKSESENPYYGKSVSNLSCEDAMELFKQMAIQSKNYQQLNLYQQIKDNNCFCKGYYSANASTESGNNGNKDISIDDSKNSNKIDLYDIVPPTSGKDWNYAIIDSENEFSYIVEIKRSDFSSAEAWEAKINEIVKAKKWDTGLRKKYFTVIGFTKNKPNKTQENILTRRLGKPVR